MYNNRILVFLLFLEKREREKNIVLDKKSKQQKYL